MKKKALYNIIYHDEQGSDNKGLSEVYFQGLDQA